MLSKDHGFIWKSEQDDCFKLLKEKLLSPPILIYPDMTKPFVLQTDASQYAIGAVLSQLDSEGHDHPIAYISRTLNKHELNYSVVEKECLAVVFACENFRHFLYGMGVTIITGHTPLQWLANNKTLSRKLIRW